MLYKKCNKCGVLKEVTEFYKRKTSKDGYRNDCKVCANKLEIKRKDKRKEKRQSREIITEGKKVCRICKLEKNISEFHIKRGTPDGHRSECKECVKNIKKKDDPEKRKEYDKKRYEENREQILERKKEYHKENKDSILEYKKQYRKDNDEQIREWRKNNPDRNAIGQLNYRKKHPHIIAWRSVLYSTLKRLGTEKSDHTIDMLGYSADQLKEHIEKQFTEGMTWDNHGDWHIDHKFPVTKFPDITPVNEVCALSNLQPLWAEDNLSKSNKI